MDDITGYAPVSLSKPDADTSAEMPRKLRRLVLQDMHLFPKVNRMQIFTQQRCCVSCLGGMLDRKRVNVPRVGRRCDHGDYVNTQKIK